MTDALPPCPACSSEYTYQMDALLVCPECGNEWSADAAEGVGLEVRDSVGNLLADGDTVVVIKDLKVKGIRLVDSDHNIDCTIPGFGKMGLKSEFVKRA